tara:strand:+ start:397 stop:774 length:378 start_codon:yes stop_codon:yes gene_type:complete
MTTSTQTVTQITQDPNMLTVADVKAIRQEAMDAAKSAALQHLDTVGENMYCGFAWVNIYGVKGNTKLGKTLKAAGIEQSYDKSYQIWNPSGVGTQCMLTKEVGAQAAAEVFVKYGFRSYMGSRAD